MNVSFGSVIVKFNPNISSNQNVFNEIRESLPVNASVSMLKSTNDKEKTYQIKGKGIEQEMTFAKAFYKALFKVSLVPDSDVYKAVEQRIYQAKEILSR